MPIPDPEDVTPPGPTHRSRPTTAATDGPGGAPDDDGTAEGVSTFDFAGSGRLTRERARLISTALDEVARSATESLRLAVDGLRVEAGDVEQRTVADLLAGPVDYMVLDLPERAERGLLITELGLARALVLTLMGGPARDDRPSRPLTPIETEVLDLLLVRLLQCAAPVLSLGPIEMGVHESDPAAATSFDEREVLLGIPFVISNEHVTGRVWIVLSPAAFQPFTAEYEHRHAARPAPTRPGDRRRAEAVLQGVSVPVVVGFPAVRVPAHELAFLQPGDVLRLGQGTSRDLVITVGGAPLFTAQAGQRGLRLVAEVRAALAPVNLNALPGGTP